MRAFPLHDLSHIFFSGSELAASDGRAVKPRGAARSGAAPSFARRESTESSAEPDPLVRWLLEQVGVDAQIYRASPLVRRLPACLRQLRSDGPASAQALLQRRAELVPLALDALLIGVSEFFRDAAVFDHLQRVVLPELLRPGRPLRVCSVGSSAGQELYSLAILLAEAGALDGAQLLGVDCRPEAVARASRGVFPSLEGLPSAFREKYFRADAEGWAAIEPLRRALAWETSDLFAWKNSEPWDLILFRNVAIYLTEQHTCRAWEKLTAQLAPGGCIVTGKAETPPRHLQLHRSAHSVYRKP